MLEELGSMVEMLSVANMLFIVPGVLLIVMNVITMILVIKLYRR